MYTLLHECHSCTKNRSRVAQKRKLTLFPATGPLEFVAIDVLGPLLWTTSGNQDEVVVTDDFSQLTRAIPTDKIIPGQVATIFLDNWVMPHRKPSCILINNEVQFVSKLFRTLHLFLGVKKLTTTVYHPQTNGEVERYSRPLVARLRHSVPEHQQDWDTYVQSLTYD